MFQESMFQLNTTNFQKNLAKFKQKFKNYQLKWTELLRPTLYFLCCFMMFYQVTYSCIDYYTYPTVVQIKIAKPDQQSLPSITVCRQITAKEYFELLKKSDSEFASKFTTDTSQTKRAKTEEAEESEQLTALDHLAEYFSMKDRNSQTFFNVIRELLQVTCKDVRFRTPTDCAQMAAPINSFTQRRICVTYFSKLYVNFNLSENNFNISENGTQDNEKEEDKESLFAYLQIDNPYNDTFVYIHTSKSMPDINLYDLELTRSRLFSGKTYGLIYLKYWVRRLEDPYVTHCENYVEKRKEPNDPLSEFGCINRCKKKWWKENVNLFNACLPIDLVYIMESDDQDYKICDCTVKPCDKTLFNCTKCKDAETPEYHTYATNCENNCRQDCYEEYYNKEKFELKDDFRDRFWLKFELDDTKVSINQTLVFLAAKYHEEISYTHVPKTNQFDFFAMMGGLFSLWIGASVLTVYDLILFLYKFCTHFQESSKKIKNKLGKKFQKAVKVQIEDRRRFDLYPDIHPSAIARLRAPVRQFPRGYY